MHPSQARVYVGQYASFDQQHGRNTDFLELVQCLGADYCLNWQVGVKTQVIDGSLHSSISYIALLES